MSSLVKEKLPAKVLITVPNEHWLHLRVVHRLMLLSQDQRFQLAVDLPVRRPYENNLHHIVQGMLAGGFDFWLNMDCDNPPWRNPLDMIALDKDIIGCPTLVHRLDFKDKLPALSYWNAFDRQENGLYTPHTPMEGFQRVDAVGSGCILIAARVFQNPAMQKAPFARDTDEFGRVTRGADIAFCERATAAGFEVYAHYDYFCSHFHEVDLYEFWMAFHEEVPEAATFALDSRDIIWYDNKVEPSEKGLSPQGA